MDGVYYKLNEEWTLEEYTTHTNLQLLTEAHELVCVFYIHLGRIWGDWRQARAYLST